MYCICLVCRIPHQIWLDFLNLVPGDIFMITNDNVDLTTYVSGKVQIIHLDNESCYNAGFNHANRVLQSDEDRSNGYLHLPFPEITAWDKALYYFCVHNMNYDYIWFIEDDCFFRDPNIFERINSRFPNTDLLVKENNLNYWRERCFWNHVYQEYGFKKNERTGFSFIQTCRLSRKLLNLILNQANIHKRLVVIETLFNSLTMRHNLSMEHPSELNLLHFDKNINHVLHIDDNKIYHPVKEIDLHPVYRKFFITNIEVLKLNDVDKHIILDRIDQYFFDFNKYKQLYPDLRNLSDKDLLHHYIFDGIKENRICNISFDYDDYLNRYSDLQYLLREDLLHHYVYDGVLENRIANNKNEFHIAIKN